MLFFVEREIMGNSINVTTLENDCEQVRIDVNLV